MQTYTLPASQRSATGKLAQQLRQQQRIPAVLYGHGLTNRNLAVEASVFLKVFRDAGSSSLVDLVVDDSKPVKVLIQAVQQHPTRSTVTHIDFYQVKMTEKLETDIDLAFTGEAPAIKELGGILVRALDKVKVECLPADLVPSIPVDISVLKTFEDHIKVKDLAIPNGITILDQPEEIVAAVQPPRSEAELEALKGEVTEDVSAVGVVEKEKAEAEPAEGEAAPATKSTAAKGGATSGKAGSPPTGQADGPAQHQTVPRPAGKGKKEAP